MPGVPSMGHVTVGGFWHPGKAEGCVKCESPRTFSIRRSDVQRCPRKSLAPSHYRDDGTCLCPEGGRERPVAEG